MCTPALGPWPAVLRARFACSLPEGTCQALHQRSATSCCHCHYWRYHCSYQQTPFFLLVCLLGQSEPAEPAARALAVDCVARSSSDERFEQSSGHPGARGEYKQMQTKRKRTRDQRFSLFVSFMSFCFFSFFAFFFFFLLRPISTFCFTICIPILFSPQLLYLTYQYIGGPLENGRLRPHCAHPRFDGS